jgi:hypothetical protein
MPVLTTSRGWWGFTFPLGVFAVSTCTLAVEVPSKFFKVLGTIFSVAVILLWVVVGLGTIRGVFSGELLYAPCVEQYEQKLQNEEKDGKKKPHLPLEHWRKPDGEKAKESV